MLKLQNIKKSYDGTTVLDGISLEIPDGEIVSILGPSGCGKTTLLNMILGITEPDSGKIEFNGKDITDSPMEKRGFNIVFQDYALFPNLNVYQNITYGLKNKPDISSKEEVDELIGLLGLKDHLPKKIEQLSGGQKQRVAMGRAIVRHPKVFLMDEPLSNLDAKLRTQMRIEIMRLYKELQTTFIYVTHDQTEAMTLGTRIVVMKDGIIQQVDTPQRLYDFPANRFVAGFIGSPQMNFISGICRVKKTGVFLETVDCEVQITDGRKERLRNEGYDGKQVTMGVRPEHVKVWSPEESEVSDLVLQSQVSVYEMLGAEAYLYFTYEGQQVSARVKADTKIRKEDKVFWGFDTKDMILFDFETEEAIY